MIIVLCLLGGIPLAFLFSTAPSLSPLLSTAHHVHLSFPGTEMDTWARWISIWTLMIIRSLLQSVFNLINPKPTLPNHGEYSLTMPFQVDSTTCSQYLLATSSSRSTSEPLEQILQSPYGTQTFLGTLTMPSIILLLCKRGVYINAVGSVNVCNTFETPNISKISSTLKQCISTPQPSSSVIIKASIDVSNRRKVKRGWEYDLISEIRDGESVVFRMILTMLTQSTHQDSEGIVSTSREEDSSEYQSKGNVKVSVGNVDTWVSLSKDSNPIHTSHLLAKLFGMRGRIAHGNLVLARALQVDSFSPKSGETKMMVNFLRPVNIPAILDHYVSEDGERIELRLKDKVLVSVTCH